MIIVRAYQQQPSQLPVAGASVATGASVAASVAAGASVTTGASVAAGASVTTGAWVAAAGGSVGAVVAAPPQADATKEIKISRLVTSHKVLFLIFISPLLQ
jgi:hypothetical protein